jgi:hypothetical protein
MPIRRRWRLHPADRETTPPANALTPWRPLGSSPKPPWRPLRSSPRPAQRPPQARLVTGASTIYLRASRISPSQSLLPPWAHLVVTSGAWLASQPSPTEFSSSSSRAHFFSSWDKRTSPSRAHLERAKGRLAPSPTRAGSCRLKWNHRCLLSNDGTFRSSTDWCHRPMLL